MTPTGPSHQREQAARIVPRADEKFQMSELERINTQLRQEIDERRRVEEALRAAHGFLQAALDALPANICILDGRGRITMVNECWRRFGRENGYPSADMGIGVDYVELCENVQGEWTEGALETARGIRAILAGEEMEYRVEYPCHRPGPQPRENWFLMRAAPFFHDEQNWVAVVHWNITERKRAEQQRTLLEGQLRQAQKLDAVGQLAGGVAHDFNNLLTAVLGNVELLRDYLVEFIPRNHEALRPLEQIEQSGQRAATLTRQLLAFSRRQVFRTEVLEPNELLRNLERTLPRILGERIHVQLALAPDTWRINADAGQLEQVILNLVLNARDAIDERGDITIETWNCTFGERHCRQGACELAPGGYVCIAVRDTGRGMDAETLERVFEPFFTTKDGPETTGLGLSTVYGIVKQAGGDVIARSEVGRGTTFEVYLPAMDVPSPHPSPRPEHIPDGSETVLVCEDETTVRRLMCQMLERAGYQVLAAANAGEAAEVAAAHTGVIHLLVSDVILPDSNGNTVAEQLLHQRPAMKVLFISGYSSSLIARYGVLEDGVEFMEKPFSYHALRARVRTILDAAESARTSSGQT